MTQPILPTGSELILKSLHNFLETYLKVGADEGIPGYLLTMQRNVIEQFLHQYSNDWEQTIPSDDYGSYVGALEDHKAIHEYLDEGNSKDDLINMLIERLTPEELKDILSTINQEQNDG